MGPDSEVSASGVAGPRAGAAAAMDPLASGGALSQAPSASAVERAQPHEPASLAAPAGAGAFRQRRKAAEDALADGAAGAGGGGGGSAVPPPRPPRAASRLLVGVLSTVLWMLCSSALIILNKSLYRRGFRYPSTVTGAGQLFSALSGLLLAAVGAQPLRPLPPARVWARTLLPITAASAATMYFGNMAYLYLSVSFIQIIKAFTPALTLLLCCAAGLERPHWPLLVSVAMIAGGTAGAVLIESGAPSFNALGFAAFMASSLTEAARVVGAELLQAPPPTYIHPHPWLGILNVFGGVFGGQSPLTKLTLEALPLTAEVVASIACAGPHLSSLTLSGYDLSRCNSMPDDRPCSTPESGVRGLLLSAASHLQHLNLFDLAVLDVAEPPAAPVGLLASLLPQCSLLESLTLHLGEEATRLELLGQEAEVHLRIWEALPQLPALRQLDIAVPYTAALHLSALSSLSQLTNLYADSDVTRAWLQEDLPTHMSASSLNRQMGADASRVAGDMAPTVAHMRNLVKLDLPDARLHPTHLQQLATALTALTYLRVGGITLEPTDEGGDEPRQAAGPGVRPPGPAVQPVAPMPPQLCYLGMRSFVDAAVLAALQLPDSVARLEAPGMKLCWNPQAGRGPLCAPEALPAVAASLLAACEQLAGRSIEWDPEDGREEEPFRVLLFWARPWPQGYGPLFAALQPAALRLLAVHHACLTVQDVEALVEHLPQLELLELWCGLQLASLTALRGLAHLSELCLYLSILQASIELDGQGAMVLAPGWDDELLLREELLSVCGAPRLQLLTLDCSPDPLSPGEACAAAVETAMMKAVDWLEEMLPQHRADPPRVQLMLYGDAAGSSDSDGTDSGDNSDSGGTDDGSGVDGSESGGAGDGGG
ncbi:putative sugar phosphate/phosphate translocator [Tetrabaena socialis]|uniref:Putative sugar phosphate/phosphate translocator n=1 Tax=Tetrabaena socialis TaxID=47790 RepID=A0A2J8A9T4_9CHLO|nr:putative sugar phosphate/phosphate translocator [Tetrabaena socialis]|eukprot:PNH09282.1 putative sugar phosphate/phosphate translocator [Tetrabaena socialis]